jgi:glucokinase
MYLSFDLGGTNIKAGLIDEMGNIINKCSLPTAKSKAVEDIAGQFAQLSITILNKTKIHKKNIKGIGIGIPGNVDPEKGFVFKAPNLGWLNINIKESLERTFDLPVFITNDANAAALGEMWKGAAKGLDNLICVTLGTGVGAGVIVDGRVHNGYYGAAGEIGHFKVRVESTRKCNCGQFGCLETESSASALVYYGIKAVDDGEKTSLTEIIKDKGELTAEDIFRAAHNGDEVAIKTLDNAAYYLGFALANIYTVIAPQRIIIGGGLANAGEMLFNPVRKWFDKFVYIDIIGREIISAAGLGNDAGIVGLAKLVKDGLNNKDTI